MAPSLKRKPVDDDFIFTISDNEDAPIEEEQPLPQPPKKKAKTAKKSKKNKKDEDDPPEVEEPESIWGRKDEDDGAMNSDFEFAAENGGVFDDEEFEEWDFDGAKKGMAYAKKGVDLEEIIRRRREMKGVTADGENVEAADGDLAEDEADNDEADADEFELDDDEDEVLADDAFGMNIGSDAEESGGEDDEKPLEDGDEPASDDDSVATPVEHPDDDGASDISDAEDAEEEAKRVAFFAPEEKETGGKKALASSFQAMSLSRPILRGLASVGFSKPTPIQSKAIPIALMGKDVVGGAVTGSGKTGAFIVPILERLLYRPKKIPTSRVVVLTPTRELAIQCHAVASKLAAHTDIKFTLAVGGLSLKMQEVELRLRPDVIIATPGRFIDHMRNSASFSIDTVEILVLDEADRMLEDGFADELNEILTTLPKSRQTMLFSATMTSTVDRLIRIGLNKPARVMVDAQKKTVGTLVQEFVRLRPGREDKRMGYLVYLCKNVYMERVIIFFRQKKDAHRARIIFGLLGITCAELHGSMNQTQRIESVETFRDGKVTHLLATDLASRGLDIKGVDSVINYEAPQSLEIYVHRVGRTARAGRTGVALTLAAEPDRKVVKAAVKAGKAQGAKISSRVIEAADVDKWQSQIDELDDEIDEVMQEEQDEKHIAHVEMQVKKGENMIRHESEIKSRPRRTWFETTHDKQQSKQAGKDELNGTRETMKNKGKGKLSGKDKKRLDSMAERSEGRSWKKGKNDEQDLKDAKKKDAAKKSARKALFGPGLPRPHPRHKQSFLRYLFPRAARDRYRERVLQFQLDTLPYLKYNLQSRINGYLVGRQRRRADKSRVLDLVARQGRRLWLGPPRQRPNKDAKGRLRAPAQQRMPTVGGYPAGYGPGVNDGTQQDSGERGERGYRRKKLAAMAGSLYRTGQQAVTDMRETYAQTRARGMDGEYEIQGSTHIPGAFPDVAISAQGGEEMVLFPSYAKRHIKRDWSKEPAPQQPESQQGTLRDEDYWRQEWEKEEDEKAIVDVDVRGWIYTPQTGPMNRRNRILIGLARQLSGISAPRADQNTGVGGASPKSHHQTHEEIREQEKIAEEAAMIERKGQHEKHVAYSGGYSEPAGDSAGLGVDGTMYPYKPRRRGSKTPDSAPVSPSLSARQNSALPLELTEAELLVGNANLIARIAPFMTYPLVALPITIFFYNESQSQSRTVLTNDAGHFIVRAPLTFIPTGVRVLANEKLSATQEVKVIESRGISMISDIDDTIKRSNISAGAREIFRNTFVRELGDLTVEGVKEWYHDMHNMGVSIHYCSNSPWQLFPVLASFFKLVGLPPGSLHLKQYSGMLQGIFEPVAERKKSTLTRLMRDFPQRKFLLVGDSGEADLEVYTELALAHPGRVLAVFIRDVTTPERMGYFDSGFDLTRQKVSSMSLYDGKSNHGDNTRRQNSAPVPPVPMEVEKTPPGPVMGTLIDFSEEPQEVKLDESAALSQVKRNSQSGRTASTSDLLSTRRQPPPRPAKPASLRSAPSSEGAVGLGLSQGGSMAASDSSKPPAPPRKPVGMASEKPLPHPLAQMHNSSQNTVGSSASRKGSGTGSRDAVADTLGPKAAKEPPPPPLPRRRATPSSLKSLSPRLWGHGRGPSSNSDVDFDPLPPSAAPQPAAAPSGMSYYRSSSRSGGTTPSGSPTLGAQGVNKKLELWKRRLARAHEIMDQQGIVLYTWRKGQDVEVEAKAIVKQAMEEMGREKRGI